MPCIYNTYTGEVETIFERYQREVAREEYLYNEYLDKGTNVFKENICIEDIYNETNQE